MKKTGLFLLLFLLSFNANALKINAISYVVKDITTNNIILKHNENKVIPPASVTKLMTLYLTYEFLEQKNISLTKRIKISKNASKKGGSKMFLEPNSKVRIVDLIKGIAVASGNDASTAMAEFIAGNEKNFVKLMNQKAEEFGMRNTHFANATGWDNKAHISTAHDLAILGERVYKDFPKYRTIYKLKTFKHNHILQYNKNTMLGKMGVDGMKTGHVNAVGYNIVTSAKKGNTRYIITLIGAKNKKTRETEIKKLLKYAYEQYSSIKVLTKNEVVAQSEVHMGNFKFIDLVVEDNLFLNLTKKQFDSLSAKIHYYPVLNAPINEGAILGKIVISYKGIKKPIEKNLVAKQSSKKITGFAKLLKLLQNKLKGV